MADDEEKTPGADTLHARRAFAAWWGEGRDPETMDPFSAARAGFIAGWGARDQRDAEPAEAGAVVRFWTFTPTGDKGDGYETPWLAIRSVGLISGSPAWQVAGASTARRWRDIMMTAVRWERIA